MGPCQNGAIRSDLIVLHDDAMCGGGAAWLFVCAEKRRGLGASVPGFLTPLPEVPGAVPQTQLPRQVAGLLDLIALAEAGPAGYNAVQHGARIRPTKPPTEMSLGEVFDWIKATPSRRPCAVWLGSKATGGRCGFRRTCRTRWR